MDPFKGITSLLKNEIEKSAGQLLMGIPCTLGTMTATGVLLDNFKHEIKDPLVLEPLIDAEIEGQLMVPAHSESGTINLPSIPTQADSPTVAGPYRMSIDFDTWTYTAGGIKITKARVKYKPQYAANDRVLCCLINNGQDVVIVARVVPYG